MHDIGMFFFNNVTEAEMNTIEQDKYKHCCACIHGDVYVQDIKY